MKTVSIQTAAGLTMRGTICGSGQTVLLLHGIPGSSGIWKGVVEQLSKTHQVVVPDLIGFGKSSRTTDPELLWTTHQAQAIRALLQQSGVRSCCVVGHDYGGPVSAALYQQAPELFSHLMLLSTNLFGDTPIPFPLSGILLPGIGSMWARMLFSRPSLNMLVKKGLPKPKKPSFQPVDYTGDAAQGAAIRVIFYTALKEISKRYAPVEQSLRDVGCPSQVLWGEKDMFFSVEQGKRTARHIGADFELISGAGHFLPHEHPEKIVAAIKKLCR